MISDQFLKRNLSYDKIGEELTYREKIESLGKIVSTSGRSYTFTCIIC